MIFVRFTRRCAGDDWEAERGEVRGLPDADARRLITRNHAEEVEAPPPPPPSPTERTEPPTAATVAAPERAVQPRARGRV